MCVKTVHQLVVRWIDSATPFAQDHPAHPSVPVRVGHQMLHESHRLRFHRGVYWFTGAPRAGKLLSMRLARIPELSVWSMSGLGT